jgi:hypothetical protein
MMHEYNEDEEQNLFVLQCNFFWKCCLRHDPYVISFEPMNYSFYTNLLNLAVSFTSSPALIRRPGRSPPVQILRPPLLSPTSPYGLTRRGDADAK